MRAQGAAPEGGSSGSGLIGKERTDHNAETRPVHVACTGWHLLPARIRELLKIEGLDSPAAWRSAGARRKQIFGIPTPMVRQLDELAKEAA
jgi:hypothetical protein